MKADRMKSAILQFFLVIFIDHVAFLSSLKIFVPITALAFVVLVPVNWTNNTLEELKDVTFSDLDKLSISNIPDGSSR